MCYDAWVRASRDFCRKNNVYTAYVRRRLGKTFVFCLKTAKFCRKFA